MIIRLDHGLICVCGAILSASDGAVLVPVDVYIPGCPPRPQAILNGLLLAMGIREARVGH